jgi:ribosome-binding protein aMBF1 (putative translation factor)
MIKWQEYRDRKLQEPEFKQAYDKLEVEYVIQNEILKSRKELGMSQTQLSALTGITQPDISKLENSKANPSVATLKKLATAFGKKLLVQFV